MTDQYSLSEHMHRFGAWAASRAASVVGCRFSVQQGKQLLEGTGLLRMALTPDALPEPESFTEEHRGWRSCMIELAASEGLVLTHGVSAKLINVYLKATVLAMGQADHPKLAALHPPIDALLLDSLRRANFGGEADLWRDAAHMRWSKFNSDQYEAVVEGIRRGLPDGTGLWRVEEHWRGYQ
jgi:hypothetical protein